MMHRSRVFFVLPAVLLACEDGLPADPQELVTAVTVVEAQASGIDQARNETIRDRESWASTWREIHARRAPEDPLPDIDFAHDQLLLVALGTRPNGCYRVEIVAVERVGERLRASVRETTPGDGCACTQALVQPVHVVRVPRTAGDVAFEVRQLGEPCN